MLVSTGVLVLGSALLYPQYQALAAKLSASEREYLLHPCGPNLLRCGEHWPQWSAWASATLAWLERHGAVSLPLLIPSTIIFVAGLLLFAAAAPKPWDLRIAVRRLQARAETDPWQNPSSRKLWVPRLHGNFWASGDELTDLQRGPSGYRVYLGKWRGKPLFIHPGWGGKVELDHTLLVAPNGSGKGMLLKATLCDWAGSAVVNELKGEFYAELGGYLSRTHRVRLLSVEGRGHAFDPFLEFPGGLGLQAAARILIKGAGAARAETSDKNAIFGDRAALLLTGALVAARTLGHPALPFIGKLFSPSLRAFVFNLYSLSLPEVNRKIAGFLAEPPEGKNWDEAQKDRFLQSCWGVFVTRIEPLLDRRILAMCSGSDFRARDLRQNPTVVFLHFPPDSIEATLPLFQLVQESLIRGLTTADQSTATHRARPILLLEDEAHVLIPPNAAKHLNTLRGWGLCKLTVLQAEAQLADIARGEGAAARAGYLTSVYYRPADQETAQGISERVGALPLPEETHSPQAGGTLHQSYRLGRVPMISPQAVLQLQDDQIVVFPRGRAPVAALRLWPTDLAPGRLAYEMREGRLEPTMPGVPLPPVASPEFDPRFPARPPLVPPPVSTQRDTLQAEHDEPDSAKPIEEYLFEAAD